MEDIRSFDISNFSQLSKPPMAHVSAAIGHYIIFIGGYRISYENDVRAITTFDKNHFLYYNVLNHNLNVIECDYDMSTIGNFPTQYFCGSGMASTCIGNRIYLFGGYSLSKQESGNALYYIEIMKNIEHNEIYLELNRSINTKPSAILKFINGTCDEMDESIHRNYPSYRDKCSMINWNEKLYVFGGYGTSFHLSGTNTTNGTVGGYYNQADHNFLSDNGEYVAGSGNRGWNNQLLVFNLLNNKWINPQTSGNVPCPRAAHCAASAQHRMIIFGGRLGLQNTAATIRSNQCFYLDLLNYQWTELKFEHDLSIVGRSWSTITHLSDHEFFIIGGFSGENVPLNDAYLFDIDFSTNTSKIIPKIQTMHQAVWDPFMDRSSWNIYTSFNPVSRMWHSTTLANDNQIYIFGGCCNNLIVQIEQIQDVIERVLTVPPTLYRICMWNIIKSSDYRDISIDQSQIPNTILCDFHQLTL